MAASNALVCPRCARTYSSPSATYSGCSACRAAGIAVNLVAEVAIDPDGARRSIRVPRRGTGVWRYASLLPVPERYAVSLGEGGTTLLRLGNLERDWGLRRLYAKLESQNPTWSHKDRLCAVGVAAARASGARVVTGSSTGNHGASIAAYAARAGLECVIFTLASAPTTMKTLMQAYGANVVSCRTTEERYAIMLECADRFGWYPLTNGLAPPIGSNPYAVDGYKTIAYELWSQLDGATPDWIVVPVGYGDCIAGIERGWRDLRELGLVNRVPRLVGAEVDGALGKSLATPDGPFGPVPTRETCAFSIGTSHTTYQAVAAVRRTEGTAATASEASMMEAQLELAGREGVYAEASSALALASVRELVRVGTISPLELVVAIVTSSGLKDPAATATRLLPVPVIDPTLEALQSALFDRWHSLGYDVEKRFDRCFVVARD